MPDSVTPPSAVQPVDVDVDLQVPAQRRELTGATLEMLSVISLGGVFGTLARYGLGVAFPHGAAGFPWATFAVNVAGCGLIGVLMVCIDQRGAHRLVRPFLGVGVLGGFTTFSTYVVEVQEAMAAGAARLALAYLGGTLAAAVVAVLAGSALTSTLIRVLTRAGRHRPKEW
ncbi:MAG TPA: CrcB family protein [Pseudonocardiaceae bacterium]|jgi:CrcB protein|nr:CrcB family protein [Pseudonocardiaceae bacterium]